MSEEAKLKKHLWDFFVMAQLDILQAAPKDREVFVKFLYEGGKTVPFAVGSTAWDVCKLCGKI